MRALIVTLLALVPVLAQDNLVPNPSFERAVDGQVEGWENEIQQNNRGVFAQDTTVALEGGASLRIEHPDDNSVWVRSSAHDIPATPLTVYRFDAAVRATGRWSLVVYEFRPTDKEQPYLTFTIATGGDTGGEWRRVGDVVTTTELGRSFKISCITTGPGMAWFDAISLVKVGAIPELDALAVDEAPVVDGRLDEAAWRDAPRAGPFYILGGKPGERPAAATSAQAVWTRDRLFIAYRCTEPAMDRLRMEVTERGGPVYTDDSVETFLDPGATGQSFAHLAVNAGGVTYDARQWPKGFNLDWYPSPAAARHDWRPEWQAAAVRGDGEWTVELAIPLAALGELPQPGDSWGVNFCRERYAEPELSTWAPLDGDRFARPAQFGKLTFRGAMVGPPAVMTRPAGGLPAGQPLVPQPQEAGPADGVVTLAAPLALEPSDAVAGQYLPGCLKLFPNAVALPAGTTPGRHVRLIHTTPLAGGPAEPAAQARFQAEGYRLRPEGAGLVLEAAAAMGFRNGLMTLRQTADFGTAGQVTVPARTIVDWPDASWRAWHVGSPARADLPACYEWIGALARLKYNLVMFEVNDVFPYESHPEIGRTGAPSKDELRQLVADCRALGLEVIPQVAVYGHFNWVLNKPGWADLAEQEPDETTKRWGRWSANIRDSRYYPLVFDLFNEVIEVFEPKIFHIGHDEITFRPIGVHPDTRDVAPADLLTEEVTRLHDWLAERQIETMMWGDQLLPEHNGRPPYNTWTAVDKLPKDILINDWHYNPGADFPSVKFFQERGYRVIASGWWNPLNIMDFSDVAVRDQTLGFSGTSWWGLQGFRYSAEHQTAFVLAAENSWTNRRPTIGELPYRPWAVWRDLCGRGGVPAETRFAPLSLARYANQSLADTPRRTGWLGLGPDNDFGRLPRGEQWWLGVPYQILDSDREAIVLAAEGDPPRSWPTAVRAIPVGTTARALYFLQTTSAPAARYGNIYDRGTNYPDRVGRYVIRYADGTTTEALMRYRRTITDWNAELPPGEADAVWEGHTASGSRAMLSAWRWDNPFPDKVIESLDLRSDETALRPIVLAITAAVE